MIAGVTDEIIRLEVTLAACRKNNPKNLDLGYMEAAIKHLRAYRDLHTDLLPLPPYEEPDE